MKPSQRSREASQLSEDFEFRFLASFARFLPHSVTLKLESHYIEKPEGLFHPKKLDKMVGSSLWPNHAPPKCASVQPLFALVASGSGSC
jgi:hypothetical protein